MTLDMSNSGDDRGREQRPASHRNELQDDAGEACVTPGYAAQGVRFSASFGVTNPNENNER